MSLYRMMKDAGFEIPQYLANSVMVTAVLGGQWESALDVYGDMQAAGMEPDKYTYNALIMAHGAAKVCCGLFSVLCLRGRQPN